MGSIRRFPAPAQCSRPAAGQPTPVPAWALYTLPEVRVCATGSRLYACFVICLPFGAMTRFMLAVPWFLLTLAVRWLLLMLAVRRFYFLLGPERCLLMLAVTWLLRLPAGGRCREVRDRGLGTFVGKGVGTGLRRMGNKPGRRPGNHRPRLTDQLEGCSGHSKSISKLLDFRNISRRSVFKIVACVLVHDFHLIYLIPAVSFCYRPVCSSGPFSKIPSLI